MLLSGPEIRPNDSLDEFIAFSQARSRHSEENDSSLDVTENDDKITNDSFDDLVSQADESEYLRVEQSSPKSKVKNWLQNQEKENFPVVRKETPQTKKFQFVRKETPQVQNFQVDRQTFQAKNRDNPGPSAQRTAAQERQALFCSSMLKFFAREQDMNID